MHVMRIALIAHALQGGGGLSVGRNIIAALAELAPEHHYLVTIPTGMGYEDICARLPNAEVLVYRRRAGIAGRLAFDRVTLPRRVKAFGPDVVLALGGLAIHGAACPQAVLFHNMYLCYPARHFGKERPWRRYLRTLPKVWLLRHCLRRSLRRMQLLLCQTSAAEERLRKRFGYTGEVLLCPNAVSVDALTGEVHATIPEPLLRLEGKTKFFYLTKYYPHKNLEALVEVFRRYPDEMANAAAVITISGDQHPGARRLLNRIEQNGLTDKIVNVGPLPQRELGAYFKHCQALAMPTLMESFSGTYLEAMHFGCPILTSDIDFARVICKDAAGYFDPWHVESLKNAMCRVMDEPQWALDLAERGRACLNEHVRSWKEITNDILAAVIRVAGR